jgi:ABC-type nitrate/sulfonate/bicarbonate transport system substrate-binding protein
MLEMHGVSRMLNSFNDIVPGYVFSGVYFSDRYVSANADVVRAFLRGLIRSFQFIRDRESEARKYLPKYTSVSEEVARRSALRDLSGGGRESFEMLDRQQDLLLKFGLIEKKASLKGIVDYSFLPE